MNLTPLRFAVVGAGVIGTWHAKVLGELNGACLGCVVDVVPDRAEKLASEHSVRAYCTLGQALAAESIDAVAVCVPSGVHGEVAIEALEAGKHLVIEKPIEVTLEAVERIAAAQRASGRLVTVISQHRFDPSSRVVLEAIRQGRLGLLSSAVSTSAWWRSQAYYESGDWRGTWKLDGGGALMNQCIHAVDLLLAAMGPPLEVSAYTACLAHSGIQVEDTAVVALRFRSGALGTIHATTAAFPGVSSRLSFHGDQGSAVIENDELIYLHAAGHDPDADADAEVETPGSERSGEVTRGGEVAGALHTPGTASKPGQLSDSHRYQYENFVEALAGREDLIVGIAEARLALSVILAVYESARSGAAVTLQ